MPLLTGLIMVAPVAIPLLFGPKWTSVVVPLQWLAAFMIPKPEPVNYAMLVRNTRHIPAIRAIHGGVWSRPAVLNIVDPTRSAASKRVGESQGTSPGGIRSVQLSDLVAEHGRIDLLKIDIEGSEKVLFEDPTCEEWLARTRVIYVELHDWMQEGCSQAFYRAIARFDFSQRHMGEIIAIEFSRH